MSTIKISDLASGTIAVTDYLAKAESNGIATKITIGQLQEYLNTIEVSGFKGVLLSTDTVATEDGFYIAGDSGTYTDNGGLIIDLTNNMSLISVTETQTVFKKVDIPVGFTVNTGTFDPNSDDVAGQKTTDDFLVDKELNRNVIDLNKNYRWSKELINESYLVINPSTKIDVDNTELNEDASLVDESVHPFNYIGNALKLDVAIASSSKYLRLIIPNDGSIKSGDYFTYNFEFNCGKTISAGLFLPQITNSSNGVVGVSSTAVVANQNKVYSIECLATTDSPYYFLIINLGLNPIINTVSYFSSPSMIRGKLANLEGINNQIEADFKKKGLLITDELYPRNLLDINRNEVEMSYFSSSGYPKPSLNIAYNHSNPSWNASSPNDLIDSVDAFDIFGYKGNVMRIKCPNNTNNQIQFYALMASMTDIDFNKNDDKFYYNFQIKSTVNMSLNVSAFMYPATVKGTNLGNIVSTPEGTTIYLQIDRNGLDDSSRVGFRVINNGNYNGEFIYIGKQVFSDVKTTSIDLPSVKQIYPNKTPFKIGELGDSKVAQQQSLPKYSILTGNPCSTLEIDYGRDGYAPTGVGGSRIIPIDANEDSIYLRANSVVNYGYEKLIIYGGANDPRNEFVQDGTWSLILGKVEDEAYVGDGTELDFSGYRSYWQSVLSNGGTRDSNSVYDVTFSACYKGIIEKLQTNQPTLQIYTKTELIRSGGDSYQLNIWIPMNDLIKEISQFYGLKVIDIANNTGINDLNKSTYFDSIFVHENSLAGERIALEMVKSII